MADPVKGWDDAAPVRGWDDAPTKGWDEPTKEATKSPDDWLNELAQMPFHERLWKLASGAPAGAVEAAIQMAAQIPAMVTHGAGFLNAMRKGETSPHGIESNQQAATPEWVNTLADNNVTNPDTYAGNLMSKALGDAMKYGGQSLASPGAGLKASIEAAINREGTEGAKKRFLDEYEKLSPVTENALNIGLLKEMGHHALKKAFPPPDYIDESGRAMSDSEVAQIKRRKAMRDSLLGDENSPDFMGPKDFVGPPEGPPQAGDPRFMGPVDTGMVGPMQDYGLPMKMPKLPKGQEQFPAISEKMPVDTMPKPVEDNPGLPALDPNKSGLLGWDDDGGYRPIATPDGLPDQQARSQAEAQNLQPLSPIRDDTTAAGATPEGPYKRSYPTIDKEFKVKAWDEPVRETPLPDIGQTDPALTDSPDGMSIRGNPEAGIALAHARTIGDAVKVVQQHGNSIEKGLATTILTAGVDHSAPFEVDPNLVNRGQVFTSNKSGERVVSINQLRGDAATILHEAVHVHTNDALIAAELGKGTPAQVKYAGDLRSLYNKVTDYLTTHDIPVLDEWTKNLREFNAYGLTDPVFQQILHSIPLKEGQTVGSTIFGAIKRFFGIKEKGGEVDSAFTKLLDLTGQWKDINTPETRGAHVAEAMYKRKLVDELKKSGLETSHKEFDSWSRVAGEFIGKKGDMLTLRNVGSHPAKFLVDSIESFGDGQLYVSGHALEGNGTWTDWTTRPHMISEVYKLVGHQADTIEGVTQLAVKQYEQKLKDWKYDPGAGKPKYDLTPADKGWTNIFTDGMGLRGPGKKQGGYIDLAPMFDYVKGVLGLSTEKANEFKKKMAAMSQEFKTPKDVRLYLAVVQDGMKDLFGTKGTEYAGMLNTQNQMVQRMVDNPVVHFVFNYMREAAQQAEKRMYGYHLQVMGAKKWATRNTKESVDFFREWIRLKADPAMWPLSEELAADPQKLLDHFESKGVSPTTVTRLKPYMDVFKDVHDADGKSLAVMGRKLMQQALYFPLGRHGPYHITVWDGAGDVRWAYAHDSLADARQNMADIKAAMPAGWKTSDVVRTDPTRIINSAMMEALLNNAPTWLHEIAIKSQAKQMEFVRNFERGRSSKYEVKGYIGEMKPTTDAEYAGQLKEIFDAISQRLRESYHLEQASAAIDIGHELLSDNSVLGDKYPNTHRWVNNMVARQIGIDLGGAKQGGIFQDALKGVGHVLTKMDGIYEGYKPEKGDNIIPDTAFKAVVKTLNYTASLMKIGLNPNVLAGNLIQNAFITLDGMRTAGRMGVNPLIAIKTQIEHLAYIATIGRMDRFSGVREFMQNAKAEGIIDPHGREDFSITDARERTRSLGPVDAIVQGPRDAIERFTNWNSVLYYKLFMDNVRAAHPSEHMDELNFKQAIYNMTHSFTGDYSPVANLMAFEKMGAKGNILSNFAKWKFNRVGRYLDDASMVMNVHKYGPSAMLPITMTVLMGLAMSGVQGTIGIVEYEAARQWANKLFGVQWKPMSAIISDYFPSIRDSWANRGMVTGLSDWVAQQFGEKTGPDFSGSMRDSSVLEVSTILPGTLVDVGKAAYDFGVKKPMSDPARQKRIDAMFSSPGLSKDIWQYMRNQHWTGITHQDTEDTVKALPVVAQEAFRQMFFDIPQQRGDQFVTQDKRKNQGNYIRDGFQENTAFFGGVKTTDEKRHDDAVSYYKYMDHMTQGNKVALKNAMVQAFEDKNQQMANYSFQRLVENHGAETATSEVKTALQEYLLKTRLEYMEGKQIAMSKMHDPTAQINAIKMIEKATAVWKGITPQPDKPPVKAW